MSASGRIGEFMKAYSVVIVMFLGYSGIVEFSSDLDHGASEAIIWLILAVVGVYGVLTFVIIEGMEF